MALNPNPSAKRILGIALQSAFGTPAASPVFYVRASKFTGKVVSKPLYDGAFMGDLADTHQAVSGTSHVEIDGTIVAALDSIGFPFNGVMNHVNYIAGVNPAPNTHEYALGLGQPSFFTVWDFTGAVTRQYQDVMFSDLTLKGDTSKVVEADIKGTGTQVTPTGTAAPVWTNEMPLTHWASVFSVGASSASTVNGKSESWEFDFKRDVTPIFTDGSRYPTAIVATTLDVTGKFTLVVDGTNVPELTAFESFTPRYVSVVCAPNAGGAESLKVEVLNAVYEDGELNVGSLKDVIKFDGTFKAVAASTTLTGATGLNSPAQVTLLNGEASGIYA